MADNDVLPPPALHSGIALEVESGRPNQKLLNQYFSTCPTIGIVYAMSGKKIINYTKKMFTRDWRFIFKKNTLYEQLMNRYKNYCQPLLEVHGSSDKHEQLIERIANIQYKRSTAYTKDLVISNLVVCALFTKVERKILSPPKIVFN